MHFVTVCSMLQNKPMQTDIPGLAAVDAVKLSIGAKNKDNYHRDKRTKGKIPDPD